MVVQGFEVARPMFIYEKCHAQMRRVVDLEDFDDVVELRRVATSPTR